MSAMKKLVKTFVCVLFLTVFPEAKAQRPWIDPWFIDTIYVAHDFEKDGIYYKFAPAPNCDYVDTSYRDEDGNLIKDGFYTGIEKEEDDILWVTGNMYCYAMVYYVRSHNEEGYEAFSGCNCSYSGDVYIPDSVEYNGRKYPVKGLGRDAFYDPCLGSGWHYGSTYQSPITSVRLPETLKYIAGEAFGGYCPYFPIKKFPEGLQYIGKNAFAVDGFFFLIPDHVLYLAPQTRYFYKGTFKYPQKAVYAGQQNLAASNIIYPPKFRHLIAGDRSSTQTGIVIPDNGDFYVHHYGLPYNIEKIYSYAPIMKNCRSGYGFLRGSGKLLEKIIYVLTGLKEAYAREWPELLAGMPYSIYDSSTDEYETHYFEEDHIIEVSREEMDAMVEAAGLTVPTAIHEVEPAPSKKVEEAIYTLDGRRWNTLQKGVNIVRQSDGTTKKVYVK